MAIRNFSIDAKQIFESNLLLIVCCAFYLLWWILAFKPTGGVRGMRTGWLLIPAFAAGLAAVVLAVKGIGSASVHETLFPVRSLLWGGIAAYLILLAVTVLLFKRQATTELFLIVGWAALALSEINALYGIGRFSHSAAVVFLVVVGAAALVSLVCYVLYYNLGGRAGYFDGMVPLLLVAVVAAGMSAAILV